MKLSPRTILQIASLIFILSFLPLLISWQWDWWEAWVYALIVIFGFVISRALAVRRHPDLLVERARLLEHKDAKPWDRRLSPLVGLGGGMILLVVGLDARFGWSPPFSTSAKIIALLVILAGYALGSYALIENRFFSSMVRIQSDRGHQVVSSGPYRWIRHPGYTGAILTYLATPIFLESIWAFLPAVFLSVILVIRTNLEDKTLQDELDGYRDYASRVRFRLLPGVW